jgi:thiosulfate dehydrogenase [quinone] large subunit
MTNNTLAFVLARIAIATSLFGHGLVRLPKLSGFSHWMVGQFQKSLLPEALVLPFSYALPIAEFLTGLLLLIGLFTKQALVAGIVLMVLLLFGTSLIENWDAIPSQLIHVAFLAMLLSNLSLNAWAVDKLARK